jgi:hypothetical protein
LKILTLTLTALIIFFGGTTQSQASSAVAVQCPAVVRGVDFYKTATWKWQQKLGAHPTRSSFKPHKILSCDYANWVGSLWRYRAHRWHIKFKQYVKAQQHLLPDHYSSWLCIHRYEGAWNSNTGNGYYGGLQFGYSEWKRFGGKFAPMAYLATPLEQMWAAEAYWEVSGFYPWPNTARACGLI